MNKNRNNENCVELGGRKVCRGEMFVVFLPVVPLDFREMICAKPRF